MIALLKRWWLRFTISGMYRDMARATIPDHKEAIAKDISQMEDELKKLVRKT